MRLDYQLILLNGQQEPQSNTVRRCSQAGSRMPTPLSMTVQEWIYNGRLCPYPLLVSISSCISQPSRLTTRTSYPSLTKRYHILSIQTQQLPCHRPNPQSQSLSNATSILIRTTTVANSTTNRTHQRPTAHLQTHRQPLRAPG